MVGRQFEEGVREDSEGKKEKLKKVWPPIKIKIYCPVLSLRKTQTKAYIACCLETLRAFSSITSRRTRRGTLAEQLTQ